MLLKDCIAVLAPGLCRAWERQTNFILAKRAIDGGVWNGNGC